MCIWFCERSRLLLPQSACCRRMYWRYEIFGVQPQVLPAQSCEYNSERRRRSDTLGLANSPRHLLWSVSRVSSTYSAQAAFGKCSGKERKWWRKKKQPIRSYLHPIYRIVWGVQDRCLRFDTIPTRCTGFHSTVTRVRSCKSSIHSLISTRFEVFFPSIFQV